MGILLNIDAINGKKNYVITPTYISSVLAVGNKIGRSSNSGVTQNNSNAFDGFSSTYDNQAVSTMTLYVFSKSDILTAIANSSIPAGSHIDSISVQVSAKGTSSGGYQGKSGYCSASGLRFIENPASTSGSITISDMAAVPNTGTAPTQSYIIYENDTFKIDDYMYVFVGPTNRKYISNYTAHIFRVRFNVEYTVPPQPTNPIIQAKVSGEWVDGTIKAKVNGEWVDATALYIKSNGTWIQIE